MRIRKHNNGRNPLLYPELRSMDDLKGYDLKTMLREGLYSLRFTSIISGIPVHTKDIGMIGSHHFYLSTRGIILYSCKCGGYIYKTHLTFRGQCLTTERPRYYLCPWDHILRAKRRMIVFLDRSTRVPQKRALGVFLRELEKARKSSEKTYLESIDVGSRLLDANSSDGIASDGSGIVWLRHDNGKQFWYVKFLDLHDFVKLSTKTKENGKKAINIDKTRQM